MHAVIRYDNNEWQLRVISLITAPGDNMNKQINTTVTCFTLFGNVSPVTIVILPEYNYDH